jgi:hypothetical protein
MSQRQPAGHIFPFQRRDGDACGKQPSSVAQLLLANAVCGAVVGLGTCALLLLLDPLGLGALLAGDEYGSLLVIVIALQFAVGFAAFAAATGLFFLDAEP